MPYYFFNWDLSRSKFTILKKINLISAFDDTHNMGDDEELKRRIEEYRHFARMRVSGCVSASQKFRMRVNSFREIIRRTAAQNHFARFFLYPALYADELIKKGALMRRVKQAEEKIPGIWTKYHPDTIDENEKLFGKLLRMIKEINASAKIYVVVFPFNPVFIQQYRDLIDEMKLLFYSRISDYEVRIIDLFELYAEKKEEWRFSDHCHLRHGRASLELSGRLRIEFSANGME